MAECSLWAPGAMPPDANDDIWYNAQKLLRQVMRKRIIRDSPPGISGLAEAIDAGREGVL